MSDSDTPTGRDENGRFVVGHVSTGGRKRMRQDVRDMLEAATPKAAQRLIEALDATRAIVVPGPRGEGASVKYVEDIDMRTKVAEMILNRIHGRAPQSVVIEDITERGPLTSLDSLTPEELAALQTLKAARLRLEAKKDDK